MRRSMYILFVIVALFAGIETWTTVSSKDTPQQPYEVVERRGALELRRYPEALSAAVSGPGGTWREVSNTGFRTLAGYIFGGNEREQRIAMTAPVHMEVSAERSTMRFIMPQGHTMEGLPRPDDPAVRLERLPEEVVAVLRFGGFADDGRIARESQRLMEQVHAAGLEPDGPVRFLGYDPPWRVAARRNEVVVRLRWKG